MKLCWPVKYRLCCACICIFNQWEVVRDQRCREPVYQRLFKAGASNFTPCLQCSKDLDSIQVPFNFIAYSLRAR